MDKVSYALGLGIGQQLAQMGATDLNIDDFAAAIKDVISGNELKVAHKDAQNIVREYFQKQEERINALRAEQGKVAKAEGEAYLKENAKKEGVITLPSGLQYKVLTKGTGEVAGKEDNVTVRYEGKTIDGNVFDSSYKRNPNTTTFRPDQVIKGWTEALTMMPQGSTWELYIPQDLAYGSRAAGNIKPYSTLIFKVELVKIDRKQEAPAKDVKAEKQTASKKKVAAKKTSKKK